MDAIPCTIHRPDKVPDPREANRRRPPPEGSFDLEPPMTISQDPPMTMPIVKYGHPVLRQRGKTIDAFDASLHRLVDEILEKQMYQADGVGLAAQQIGKALQLTVVDVSQSEDRPSSMTIGEGSGFGRTHAAGARESIG